MAFLTPLDMRLLDEWQRDLPLVARPFAAMAQMLNETEDEVLMRLVQLRDTGTMARVGATCRPNTVGASTLAALSVPEWRIEEVAQIVGSEPGVNHSYLREDEWNIWFVATAPDADTLSAILERIAERSGLRVLNLPLQRAFNVDLGFRLDGPRHVLKLDQPADLDAIREGDRAILQTLTDGLPLVPQPFAEIGARLGMTEEEVIARIAALSEARIITRMGIIVRHRALGWRSNAMVTWKLPLDQVEAAGKALIRHPGVTLCYERRLSEGWEHPLFCMVHAKTRSEALEVIAAASVLPELAEAEPRVLFSIRCFKQTGAMLQARPVLEAAE
ncbi:AsnC family transcriptional regulator [Sinirhodobacter sp. WL0062]|uniref:siroheme decarboxylase n=1 Tax=Rhodobacter flavimaris TaxID=2907145 RepID=A0ABS8YZE4_9RHOB|nr:AsnC family transcriptional regulator [Sinirhodobacter sp. WL0062]MCE5973796.1 AsnC family transcriptional regulator [Sinirhodobacter sp. WL0062]